MIVDIKGKKILVTASTSGIGKGVAKSLAMEGAYIFVSSRNLDRVIETVKELKNFNENVWGDTVDLTNMASIDKLVNTALSQMGGIDILVVNSGNPPSEPSTFFENDINEWEYSIHLYLLSSIKLVKLITPYMIKRGWGRIFFLSSYTVKEPHDIFVLADVSRAPLLQLTKLLSRELGRHGITVNTILMGSFETTGAVENLRKYSTKIGRPFSEVWKEMVVDPIPVGKLGKPEKHIGKLITYLSSEYGDYITGTYIVVDGGVSRAI
ncbi:3-oxoacyl-ACP reductase [Sulfolobales archaeon HS-7]|nr:3-oxoacyl-ACP reductase [Sulfolobales archaeon HS-7]